MKPNLVFLSHSRFTTDLLQGQRGEVTNAEKLKVLFQNQGYPVSLLDIFELFGGYRDPYHRLASLNHELALLGHEIIEEFNDPEALAIKRQIQNSNADFLFILSWCWSVAALLGCDIQNVKPTVTKLYVHRQDEIVLTPLYQKAHLLVTESLLANQRAIASGIPAWKLIHLPHHYPEQLERIQVKRNYLKALAASHKKEIPRGATILGMASRTFYGKNCEYGLEVARKLYENGKNIILVLKGVREKASPFHDYHAWIEKKCESLCKEKWFFWDQSFTSFPDVLQEYATFDIVLHLSGLEAGSNVVVECLALGKCLLLLDAGTNPSLFKGGACFVKSAGLVDNRHYLPDENDLYDKLNHLLENPSRIKEIENDAKKMATLRFHPKVTLDRLPLVLRAAQEYAKGSREQKGEVERLYEEDLKRYGL